VKLQHKHIVALLYSVALFLDRLDLTIVNITLPTLSRVFHVSLTATDWVNLSFLLALAIAIPISCWLGQRFGFKKIFILSVLLFGAGSTLCAWAPNITALILLRFIHGIGGGMLIPVGMTILYKTYDKSEYASITSFTFLPALVAPAIAPFLGGILLDAWNWQAVFLLSAPICLLLAVVAVLFLRNDEKKTASRFRLARIYILLRAINRYVLYLIDYCAKRIFIFYYCRNRAIPPFALSVYSL
jgi:MFS family permease